MYSGFGEHLERLYESARSILLDIPVGTEEMEDAVLETVRKNGLTDAYIRLVVSRGKRTLSLDPAKCSDPQVIIIADQVECSPRNSMIMD